MKEKKEKKVKKKRKFNPRLLLRIAGGIIVVMIVGFIIATHIPIYKELCNDAYDALANMSEGSFRKLSNTKIYDAGGELIGEINSGSYKYVPIDSIPLNLQNAYIAAEDRGFKLHDGVDYISTVRAGLALIKNKGKITQGGSTITQQVIKNNLLSQEQTFTRKFLEILIAPELEKKYNKAEIMEFYCNSNFYGNGCYGIGSASRFYFGKKPKELTLAEAAMLAGISNSPNKYNPIASEELAQKKEKQVLSAMLDCGFITNQEYKTALKEEIEIAQTERSLISSGNYMCSYAVHCAALELMKKDGFEFKYTFDTRKSYKKYKKKYSSAYKDKASLIRSGGYKIYTSLKPSIQKKLQKSINDNLSGYQTIQDNGNYAMQSAGVCIDNKTGYVVAIVGGRGDSYNRAFLSSRQPGSCIKPLYVYGPGLDTGLITPSTVYEDKVVHLQLTNNESYSPKNSNGTYMGKMTIREALARSINTIAFQVAQDHQVGLDYLDSLRFTTLDPADATAPSIALGGFTNGVSVVDMAKGYATIANHGIYEDKTCLVKLTHEQQGNVYTSKEAKSKTVFHQDAAFMLTDMMEGVVEESYGTGRSLDIGDQIVAGKTGTTNSNRDAWFCGFTRYYTTAIWVGRDDNKAVEGLYGNSYPLKIFGTFMKDLHEGKEKKDFPFPQSLYCRKGDDTFPATELTGSGRTYDRRPSGVDYYSPEIEKKGKVINLEKQVKKAKEKAEEAVSTFESFRMDTLEKALKMETLFNNASAIVEEIPDEYEQKPFKKRLNKKYKLLTKELAEEWQSIIDEYREQKVKKDQAQGKINAQKDLKIAAQNLHDQRVSDMEWYLSTLEKCEYNSDSSWEIFENAKECLEKCKDYQEYTSLYNQLKAQKERIEQLPEEDDPDPDTGSSSGVVHDSSSSTSNPGTSSGVVHDSSSGTSNPGTSSGVVHDSDSSNATIEF